MYMFIYLKIKCLLPGWFVDFIIIFLLENYLQFANKYLFIHDFTFELSFTPFFCVVIVVDNT